MGLEMIKASGGSPAKSLELTRSHFKTDSRGHFASTEEALFGEETPPFSKGGQGGLKKRLIIPLNPPLGKGDFISPPFFKGGWGGFLFVFLWKVSACLDNLTLKGAELD